MTDKAKEPGVQSLGGILYRAVRKGRGKDCPNAGSIVSVNYKGTLISGKKFDDSVRAKCPPAFRLRDLITGWQIALKNMHVGDKWEIYIPQHLGYGARPCGNIPAFSTLIFEVELLNIA